MPQLNFEYNLGALMNRFQEISVSSNNVGSVRLFPFLIHDSISWNTINIALRGSGAAGGGSLTLSIGLYSLNGSTLSLANSASQQLTGPSGGSEGYHSIVNTSATQNITPGTWWLGFNISNSNWNNVSYLGGNMTFGIGNAFPGSFIGGRMTVSSSVLPASVATSDLDITGNDAMFVPYIILSA